MKFLLFVVVVIALAAKVNAQTSANPCLAKCEIVSGVKECTFIVKVDYSASELGYYIFSGANGDCGGTSPTLGIEKRVTYNFIQEDISNYYRPLGFAYGANGAHDDQPELEPGVSQRYGFLFFFFTDFWSNNPFPLVHLRSKDREAQAIAKTMTLVPLPSTI